MKQTLIVGDELDQTTDVPDYLPSDGWQLSYFFVPQTEGSGVAFSITSVATDDDKHRHFVASSSTANWTAGNYSCFAVVENSGTGASITIDPETGLPGDTSIVVKLQPNPRTITSYDGRSYARKLLDMIEASLDAMPTGASWQVQSYTIGNRSITYKTRDDAIVAASQIRADVARENITAKVSAGLPNPRYIHVRFGR